MTEHDLLLRVQPQLDAKQKQIEGLVAEWDLLAARVAALEAQLAVDAAQLEDVDKPS